MSKRYFEGIVSTVTPLTVAAFGDPAATTKMKILTANGQASLPIFPGNDMRGRMRRQAANAVLDVVKAVPLPIFHVLNCGAATAAPAGGAESVRDLIVARNDLYLGLFGGGPRLHRSGMKVRSMVPVNNATIELGLVPEEFASHAARYIERDKEGKALPAREVPNCTDNYTFVRIDDVLRCTNLNMPELIENYQEVAFAYANQERDVATKRKTEKVAVREAMATKRETGKTDYDFSADKTKKADLANIMSVEAIMPGAPLYIRIDFDEHLSDAQVFLAAQSLAGVFNTSIGGWGRVGFGVVRPINLHYVNGDRTDLLVVNEGTYAANRALPGCDECETQMGAYTLDALKALYMSTPPVDAEEE